jgi:surfactin synthase thioesterase subunit
MAGTTASTTAGDDAPHAEIHLLDGGHFVLESHLDAIVALIRRFLERTAGA